MRLIVVFLLFVQLCAFSSFTEVPTSLPGVWLSCVDWGDYDNDGDLDILLTGHNGEDDITAIYRNDGGSTFVDINAGFSGGIGDCKWGDYDNDGDLDILSATCVYRNNGDETFTDITIQPVNGNVDWGDYDNDGDLDILIGASSKVYRNDGNDVFSVTDIELTGIRSGTASFVDYNNDGHLDIFLSGLTGEYTVEISEVYKNDGNGNFSAINAGLIGLQSGQSSWGDYDNDGDQDVIITGYDYTGSDWLWNTKIYRNDGNDTFKDILTDIVKLRRSSTDWGDYDNDGDLDVIVCGSTTTKEWPVCDIYRNDGNDTFNEINAGFKGVRSCDTAFGDYDNDGDLDVLLAGTFDHGYPYATVTKLYRNNTVANNALPTIPLGLSSLVDGTEVLLSWDKATDPDTPQAGLTYNISIGSASMSCDLKDPMSDISTGKRKIVNFGNLFQLDTWTFDAKEIPSGTYYWSVQTIDNTYESSAFSPEDTFQYTSPLTTPPIADEATDIEWNSFKANWEETCFSMGFFLDIATDSTFTDFLSGYENRDVGKVYSLDVTTPGMGQFYYRLRAYNADLTPSGSSNIISVYISSEFEEIHELPGFSNASLNLIDYDDDDDLDIFIAGYSGTQSYSKIYQNNDSIFIDANVQLTGVENCSSSWGDYDNDGDIDLLISGDTGAEYVTVLYRNDGMGAFIDTGFHLSNVAFGSSDWGDYDNDGDLDILLTGTDGSSLVSKLFRNDSGTFSEVVTGLPGVYKSFSKWGDYDNDGDLDIVLGGHDGTARLTKIFNNTDGVFTDLNVGLTGVSDGDAEWGDFDGDGDMDLLIIGSTGTGRISSVYVNDSTGVFNYYDYGLEGISNGSCSWGNYDSDGYSDILLTGETENGYRTIIYKYNFGSYTEVIHPFPGVAYGGAAWADINNDHLLDFVITGKTDSSSAVTKVIKGSVSCGYSYGPPVVISSLVMDDEVTFSWDKYLHDDAPYDRLTYNLYVRSDSTGNFIKPPLSNINGGARKVIMNGNAGKNNTWKIQNLPYGTYTWGVQTVDNLFRGSSFRTGEFFVGGTLLPPENVNIDVMNTTVTITWLPADNATSYRIYACDSVTGSFTDISSSGLFDGLSWSYDTTETKYFYYVVSVK